MYIYIYIYIHIDVCVYVYIYINICLMESISFVIKVVCHSGFVLAFLF